jgi:predicted component of type VI protein secretion system
MLVSVVQGDLPGQEVQDPFGSSTTRHPVAGAAAIPEAWDNNLIPDANVDAAQLDPLAALGGRPEPAEPPLQPVNWQQASPLADHFEPPAPRAPAPGGIPENWDRTGMNQRESRPPAPPTPRRPQARPVPPPTAPPRVDVQVEVQARAPAAAGRVVERRAVPRAPARPPTQPAMTPRAPVRAPESAPPAPTYDSPAPVASAPGIGADLAELLRGAGLSERDLSPEVARTLGQVLRVVVQGVIDVLRARSEIKQQFRLPMTRVSAVENNPLKLSPNVESALHTLLVQRNPGYLPTVQAFEDAFGDIRSHQMAMLEGIRVAFDSMLNSFNPAELEKEFERATKRSGVLGSLGAKSKYWDLYGDRFENLTRDADDTFRRMFGDTFAEAYEQQLERLRTLDRHNRKR